MFMSRQEETSHDIWVFGTFCICNNIFLAMFIPENLRQDHRNKSVCETKQTISKVSQSYFSTQEL